MEWYQPPSQLLGVTILGSKEAAVQMFLCVQGTGVAMQEDT
jgi:hypothetical protein